MRSGGSFPVGIFALGIILLIVSIGEIVYTSRGGSALILFPIALALLAISSVVFWLWMLVDCATNESDQGNTKIVWILIILFANLLGALAYFFVRRSERSPARPLPPASQN